MKPYRDMNTKLRKQAKIILKKKFFKLMNNVTADKRRNQLASEYNCHITKYFSENLMAIEMKKKAILVCQYFGIILLNQNIKTEQNYATWTLTTLLFILK